MAEVLVPAPIVARPIQTVSRRSAPWQVYIPTGLRVQDIMLPLRLGDLINTSDPDVQIDMQFWEDGVGYVTPVYPTVRHGTGSLTLQVAEEVALAIERLGVLGAPFPIQRRFSCNGKLSFVEHYDQVYLLNRRGSSLTATGPTTRDATPLVDMGGMYMRRVMLDRQSASDTYTAQLSSNLVSGLAYVTRPYHRDCNMIVRMIREGPNSTRHDVSYDGGLNWDEFDTVSGDCTFLHTYRGRIFSGYSPIPSNSHITVYDKPPEDRTVYYPREVVCDDTSHDNMEWVRMCHADRRSDLLFLAFNYTDTEDPRAGVMRSVDHGNTFQTVLDISFDNLTLYDVAAAGRVVIAAGARSIQSGAGGWYSLDGGDTWMDWYYPASPPDSWSALAVAVACPDPARPEEFVAYISVCKPTAVAMAIYKTRDMKEFELVFEQDQFQTAATRHYLYTDLSGWLVYWHGTKITGLEMDTRKSMDGGVDWYLVNPAPGLLKSSLDARGTHFAVCPWNLNAAIVGS